jgi:hypothetical protein
MTSNPITGCFFVVLNFMACYVTITLTVAKSILQMIQYPVFMIKHTVTALTTDVFRLNCMLDELIDVK